MVGRGLDAFKEGGVGSVRDISVVVGGVGLDLGKTFGVEEADKVFFEEFLPF